MQDVKKTFRKLLVQLIIFCSILIGTTVLTFLMPISSDIKMGVLLVSMILLLIVLIVFSPKMQLIVFKLKHTRLIENACAPIAVKFDLSNEKWIETLLSSEFLISREDDDFIVLHRTTLDSTKLGAAKRVLEVVILIKNSTLSFNHPNLSDSISQLFVDYQKKRIRFRSFSFVQIKFGDELSSELKEEINHVVFDVSRGQHVTVINGFYNTKTKRFYFLHNESYHPTIYYKYTVDLIKQLTQ